MDNVEKEDEVQQSEEQNFDFDKYLNENGLIQKWEESGVFQGVTTNSEKYLIASVMEAMIFRTLEMSKTDSKTEEELATYQEKYMNLMASIGVFNGELLRQVEIFKP